MYKNMKVWVEDHKRFKHQSTANDRAMIEEFSELINNRNTRMIDGKRYKIVPMDSDNLIACGTVRKAKKPGSNRVGQDG